MHPSHFVGRCAALLTFSVLSSGCYGWQKETTHPLVLVESLRNDEQAKLRVTLNDGSQVVFQQPKLAGPRIGVDKRTDSTRISGTAVVNNKPVREGFVLIRDVQTFETWRFSTGRTAGLAAALAAVVAVFIIVDGAT